MIRFILKQLMRNPFSHFLMSVLRNALLIKNNTGLIIESNCDIKNTVFGKYNKVCYGSTVTNSAVGDYTYFGNYSVISNCSIGKYCSIANDVMIGLGKHPSGFVSTHPAFYRNREEYFFSDGLYFEEYQPIIIGNDVWIGARVMIVDGVTIGDGAIIAAGSVVTKNVEPYTIVGGVPAKFIKERFDMETRKKLIKIKWWDLELQFLKENWKDFHDVEGFKEKYFINERYQ